MQTSDPECNHTVRLIDLVRLPSHQGDPSGTMIVSIFEAPGRNYLQDLLNFSSMCSPPVWFKAAKSDSTPRVTKQLDRTDSGSQSLQGHLPLSTFLDFAIGACECLELMHHGIRVVHGEIRGDAFYFNQETGAVKIINYGSGPRSFENGLTSTGWLALSREIGIKSKLQFVAPEQTGRMHAEPDSRTDIYSLGILFWTLLTRQAAFDGDTPLDVVQAVLGRRIPPVSAFRIDIPDAISGIIRKMTQKQIDERYHSTSGLKYDLVEIQKILGDGDSEALANFKIGSKDVSSFFVLPTSIFGRDNEHERIVKVIEKVSHRQQITVDASMAGALDLNSTSTSSISDGRYDALETGTKSSDTSSQAGKETRYSPSLSAIHSPYPGIRPLQLDSQDNLDISASPTKPSTSSSHNRDLLDLRVASEHQSDVPKISKPTNLGAVNISNGAGNQKYRRRGKCEVVTIVGVAGSGKSSLIQSTQGEIRRLGYFASAKFDPARKAPFEPLLRAMGSLFRQIFSESDINSNYHNTVRGNIGAFWPTLCSMLDLPESLISLDAQYTARAGTVSSQHGSHLSLRPEITGASSTSGNSNTGSHASSDFFRGSTNPRSLKFMHVFLEVLRVLSANKLICLCLDDLQYADEESLDLISNIMSRKLGIAIIVRFPHTL